MDTEDTLFELPEGEQEEASNPIEKPKRKATEKQLAALAAAREKRKTKMTALDKAAVTPQVQPPNKTIGQVVRLPEAEPQPIILKKPKLKRSNPKPTIIQFESDDSSSSSDEGGAPAPTIIIRNGKRKTEPKKPAETEKPVAAMPVLIAPPRQYIRRAY